MKSLKKITAVILSLALTFTTGTVCFAQAPTADTPKDQQVFVTFVYGGNSKGEWVVKGTNVTAPEVPVLGGATFCGWNAPLTNIQTNQQILAIYKPNYLGEGAIEATKKSLPTPAISATKVADPNAAPPMVMPIAVSGNAAVPMTAAQAQQQALLNLLMQQQAAAGNKAAATQAAPAATPAATAPAATTPAATATAPAATAAAAAIVNFTDKDGNQGTFTQKEWNTLLNVYGGSEAVLRKHSLGDLKKVAAYYGG